MDTLYKVLHGKEENHILPFFWQHGESDEELLKELDTIQEAGIRAVCVESRPHPGFGEESWYEDMELILTECKKRGMDFWLLDDSHFPTGYANGDIQNQHPELGKHAICEQHMDVMGPMKDCGFIVEGRLREKDRLLGIVACERYPGDGEKMTGKTLDLSNSVKDGIGFWDVPEGCWRIFFLYDMPYEDHYIDPLRSESVKVLMDAVYQPHYDRFKEYFGSTFKGFFSDEPFIMRDARLPIGDECRPGGKYPWNQDLQTELEKLWGEEWLMQLPALWFPSDTAAAARIGYMDAVTKLYSQHFCYQLGNWSRDHGVEYIGHIVEDNGYHCNLITSAGHYFRALDGQDMSGIDVVLCQIVPGMQHQRIQIPCSYNTADPTFFHYGLAKLGSSHAHIQPEKKGRAMCEIYGAYGWAEGLHMMKWLTDHMLVRGINQYVPHAFSPKFPDPDCPPHFYGKGQNPEYRAFAKVMGYMNRVSDLLSGGRHHAVCGVLYHAQAQWSGGKYMKFEQVAKVLTESQLDYDVIPEDYLAKAGVEKGCMKLAEETYPAIVVPYTEILDDRILKDLNRMAENGVQVIYIDSKPAKAVSASSIFAAGEVVSLEDLPAMMQRYAELRARGKNTVDLRYYHYNNGGQDLWFLTNEEIREVVEAEISLKGHGEETVILYDPMENQASRIYMKDSMKLRLEPYHSIMLIFGETQAVIPEFEKKKKEILEVTIPEWSIAYASACADTGAYDPLYPDFSVFKDEKKIRELYNIVKEQPRFAGFVKYETELDLNAGEYELDLGAVGEDAVLYINGKYIGEKLIPPYRFQYTAESGTQEIRIITTSHLGYNQADHFSSFLAMEPVGLLGPVTISRLN